MTRLLSLALLLTACGGAAASTQTRAAEGSCPEGGVPDTGTGDRCEIRVGTCCYAEQHHACAAASCPAERCTLLESYPAQIGCE